MDQMARRRLLAQALAALVARRAGAQSPEMDLPDREFFLSQMEGEDGADLDAFLGPGGLDVPYWALLKPGERPEVRWAIDQQAPDYAALAEAGSSENSFRITADTLRGLAQLNGFALPAPASWPAQGPGLLFGLRGCALVGQADRFSPTLELRESTPDHQTYHCVMGILRPDDTLAGFTASTVCNVDFMYVQTLLSSGQHANLLPTGLHTYQVGTHRRRSPRPLPSALIQQRPVMALRCRRVERNVMQLQASGDWDGPTKPYDNIHVAYGVAESTAPVKFSSAGCQVLPGDYRDGRMTHSWGAFCRALGLVDGEYRPIAARDGDPQLYTYMLLTGREARLLAEGRPEQGLRRLRFGASGPAVAALRARLRLPAGSEFDAATQNAVLNWQGLRGLKTSLITPEEAGRLGITL